MSAPTSAIALAERTDIHKSCKALEVVVNLLNDYCEAAGAVVQLQKKLAKAVRDAASLKTTSEIAGNALNASALLFEALTEVHGKFVKLADKECEGLSTEVRKWFKKLAKEEKAHDDRIAGTSAKIKQAGLSYEKKAKKSPRDATEEHSRYLALLGALGPEMNQDSNHAVFVTQRHSGTTSSVAACLARIADAEWLRSCENVRRFAPTVGQLGAWRALCEGGWSGPQPPDLPGGGALQAPPSNSGQNSRPSSRPTSRTEDRREATPSRAANASFGSDETPRRDMDVPAHEQTSLGLASPTPLRPQESSASPDGSRRPSISNDLQDRGDGRDHFQPDSVASRSPRDGEHPTSLASLAAFPEPPTHFPLPNTTGTPTGHQANSSMSGPVSGQSTPGLASPSESSTMRSVRSGPRTPSVSFAAMPRVVESPQHEADPRTPITEPDVLAAGYPFPTAEKVEAKESKQAVSPPVHGLGEELAPPPKHMESAAAPQYSEPSTSDSAERPTEPEADPTSIAPLSPSDTGTATLSASGHSSATALALRRGDYLGEREFGVDRLGNNASKSLDAIKNKAVYRSDSSNSNGSVVASMRGRYTHTNAPSSPVPRDVPKLPLSVSEIANKYRTAEGPTPRGLRRATSPPAEVHSPATENGVNARMSAPRITEREAGRPPLLNSSTSSRAELASSTSSATEDYLRRKQRLDELEELELREREYELRQRERDIEQRTLELEHERARIANARTSPLDGYTSDGGGGRSPRTRGEVPPVSGGPLARPGRFSASATHLVPPMGAGTRTGSSSSLVGGSQPGSPAPPPADHAPSCGCQACSVAKYQRAEAAPSPRDLRPPEAPLTLRPQAEKPKGWMRRLSMPVGAAFSLDSAKKTPTSASRNSMAFMPEEDIRQSFNPKSPGNRSTTNFGRR